MRFAPIRFASVQADALRADPLRDEERDFRSKPRQPRTGPHPCVMDDNQVMPKPYSAFRVACLALPPLVLIGYGSFIVTTYRPYLDWNLRLRSPELAGLPEDIIGWGFWMWWPIFAVLFATSVVMALSAMQWRLRGMTVLISAFILLSASDYWLCERLIQELISS